MVIDATARFKEVRRLRAAESLKAIASRNPGFRELVVKAIKGELENRNGRKT